MGFLLIGFGIVGSNIIDYLKGDVIVIEPNKDVPISYPIKKVICQRLTEKNFEHIFNLYTSSGDIIIDTAVELDTFQLCTWAYINNRHYINTVCDKWLSETLLLTNNFKNINNILYQYVRSPLEAVTNFRTGPTCLLGHGANIGMVNHFFKLALLEASKFFKKSYDNTIKDVKEVYIIEKDTLIFNNGFIPDNNTFYNTWNILEFLMESSAKADYPTNGFMHKSNRSEIRDIFLDNICVHGRVVSHEETYTIDAFLQNNGVLANKIQFLYECSPIGEISRIKHTFGSTYKTKAATYELNPNEGYDLVGILILFQNGLNWFYGYKMYQENVPDHSKTNATAWFVSSAVLAGIMLIKHNPNEGINFPENLDLSLNQKALEYFLQHNLKMHLDSRPIKSLFMSSEYPTYEVHNVHTGQDISKNC